MTLGRVVGNVVATARHDSYRGTKVLVVQPEDPDGTAAGDLLLAIDGVGAGVGERVLVVVEGRSAGEVAGQYPAPIDSAIVGVVDRVDLL